MKTLLVIAQQPALASAIKAVLDGSRYRIMQQSDLREDELLLIPSSIDACILDAELTTIEPIRTVERLRKCLPKAPIIIFAATTQWEWEEDAYLLGVNHVLTKPVRARLLNSLLDRLWESKAAAETRVESHDSKVRTAPAPAPIIETRSSTLDSPRRMLEVLRNCSSILTHSLCAESLLKEFLLLLREIIGVNRAAIFLRSPPGSLGDVPNPEDLRRLHSACAIGLAPGLLEHFQLSLDAGIGGYVFKSGRILRFNSEEALRDPQMQKEFELLSAQVAIPVLDRESFIGLAVFDGRITGDAMTNEELALMFHLLEQLGMAVRNIWLHDQVSANHEMMADILRHLSSACVVIGRDLSILHANDMAKSYFPHPEKKVGPFEFRDFPQTVGSKVFEVFKTGQSVAPSRIQVDGGKVFQFSITPFKKANANTPSAALLVVEDFTQVEKFQHLEIEAANLRLVKQMAERLAHEIGNAVVPISTHQQLLREQIDDPDFQKSLEFAMDEGVKRVTRLVNQMRFLARDQVDLTEPVTVKELIEDAFREARLYQPSTSVLLQFETNGEQLSLFCDRVGLRHAFAEVILNALQANAQPAQVQVRATCQTDQGGKRWARIEVQDSGAGFTAESAGKAAEPFYTTRNVGLGLGLAVTTKIIQTHRGKLEIPTPQTGQPSVVRISLPLEPIAHEEGESSAIIAAK